MSITQEQILNWFKIFSNIETQLIDIFHCNEQPELENLMNDFFEYFEENKILCNSNNYYVFMNLFESIIQSSITNKNLFHLIEEIVDILACKYKLSETFNESDLFKIFSSNKQVLLIFLQHNLISFKFIYNYVNSMSRFFGKDTNFIMFFLPELMEYSNSIYNINSPDDITYDTIMTRNLYIRNITIIYGLHQEIKKFLKDPEGFKEMRKEGRHENKVIEMIKNDDVDSFVHFYENNKYDLHAIVPPSIFESNQYIIETNNFTTIEYILIYGAVNIFKYLMLKINKVKRLTNDSIEFAIIGGNFDMIHILEGKYANKERKNDVFKKCIIKAIQCHRNDIIDYLKDTLEVSFEQLEEIRISLQYYDFTYFLELVNESTFDDLCKNGDILNYFAFFSSDYLLSFALQFPNFDINVQDHVSSSI